MGLKMNLTLINHSTHMMPRKFVEQWLGSILGILAKERGLPLLKADISVVFLESREAKKLNRSYRGKNYATDILSFQGEGAEMGNLGELVLCPEVLKKQAAEHDLPFKAELGYMLIHGVLHLLGHDHEKSNKEAERMFKIQDQLFDRLRAKFEI